MIWTTNQLAISKTALITETKARIMKLVLASTNAVTEVRTASSLGTGPEKLKSLF